MLFVCFFKNAIVLQHILTKLQPFADVKTDLGKTAVPDLR